MSGYRILTGILVLIYASAAIAAGPVYFVSNAGSDSNNGLTPNTPWKTVNKVNATVRQQGADVYFRAGDVWNNQQLRINWSGTATDPVVVGAYHMVNGKLVYGNGTLRKPEINGTFKAACRTTKSCAIDSSRAVPTSSWQGLVVINGDNVTVRNLRLRDSAGAAVTFSPSTVQRNIVIENNEMAHWAKAIINAKRVQHIVIRGNVAREGNYCDLHKYPGCTGGWWAAGIYINDSSPAHALLENNEVTQNYGEGLSCLRSSHVIIRGNRSGNNRSTLFYLDNCSDSVVEQNIGWSDPTKKYHWTGTGQEGVALVVEDYKDATARNSVNNIIRNNMIAGMGACIRVDMDSGAKSRGRLVGAKIHGNTCMGTRGHALLNFLSDANVRLLEVSNNIFHSENTTKNPCRNNSPNSVAMRNNNWSKTPESASCRGRGDVVGNPRVNGSGWATKSFNNQPKISDFQLRSDSPARRAGVNLGTRLSWADQLLAKPFVRSPCAVFDNNDLSNDYRCVKRPSTPNMGALEDGTTARPAAPVLAF